MAVVSGDPGKSGPFVIRAKFPANYTVPPHHHPGDEMVRVLSGGSLTWLNQASETVTATGSTDAGGSGLGSYQFRTSTNGGGTWGSAASGASVTVTV